MSRSRLYRGFLLKLSKELFRQKLKTVRREITLERRQAAAKKAFQELMPITQRYQNVVSYFAVNYELDIFLVNQELLKQGQLILPKVQLDQLTLYRLTDFAQLKLVGRFFEPDPSLCRQVEISEIDLFLVPGLGFDKANNSRIGYGKGHYDKLFANNHSAFKGALSALTIGVGFMEQAIVNCFIEPHDYLLQQTLLF